MNRQGVVKVVLVVALSILALMVMQGQAFATSSGEDLLSLDQAVAIALKTNPALKQQANLVESAELTALQRQADFYPEIELTASGSQRFDQAVDQTTGRAEDRNFETLNAALSSSVNLFNGFGDVAALKGSKLELAADRENLSRKEQDLVFETISRFIEVLTSQELMRVEEENLVENRSQLEAIEAFCKAGNRPVSDLFQQQAQTSQTELDLLEARRNLEVAKLQLMQTMGLAPTVSYRVVTPEIDRMQLALPDEDQENPATHAQANRPDVKAQQQMVEAASEQIHQAEAGYLPKIDLVASLASNYSSLDDEMHFSEQFLNDNTNATIGLTLSIPIFDRFLTRNEVAQARIQQRNEGLALQQLNLQVGLEVGQALQDYRTAKKQVGVAEKMLTYARQALDAQEERYRLGASTLVELTQARAQYVSAASGRIRARENLLTQGIAVAYYQGDWDRMLSVLSAGEKEG